MISEEYAKALFSITEEEGCSDSVLEDIEACRAVLEDNAEYFHLTDTPSIPKEEKLSLVNQAFSSVNANLKNMISLLCERGKLYLFPKIAKEYLALYDAERGIINAEIISAAPLDGEQLSKLVSKLEADTGKRVRPRCIIDKSVIGGVKLRYMGVQEDGTVKARLSDIEKALKECIV